MTVQDVTPIAAGAAARRRLDPVWIYRLLFLAGFLGVWQLSSGRLVDPFWISSPYDIGSTLLKWTGSGLLQRHLLVTFQETIIGFSIGSTLGVLSALVIGSNDMLRRTIDPFLTAVYGVPKVALAPLFIMWFGIGLAPKIVLAAVSVFFLVFFSTISGIAQVDRKMVDGLRIMGASPLTVQRKVVFPASLPWIFTGLKLGLPYGFVGAVAAEMMASNAGIGFLTQDAAGQLSSAGVFSALFALMVVTSLLNEGLGHLEKWIFRWK
ncbi:ABC transporter permease [Neorhizobium sp. LjRoot104]|uniref:ABC transporter permease n=1 Tax=Neorhizobium sp. LjRoot104 TaxID=3342254 RepID=UPI003ECD4EB0